MNKRVIAIDGQLFLKGKKTGIHWYAYYIMKNLIKRENFFYLINAFTRESIQKNQDFLEFENDGYKLQLQKKISSFWYKLISQFVPIPYSNFFSNKVEITLFFSYLIPPGVKGKKIVFIYDMGYKAYPNTLDMKTKLRLKTQLKVSVKRADKIITVSNFSKHEIIKYLNVEPSKIEVVPAGVDLNIYHPDHDIETWEMIKKKYNLPDEYILYLGTLEPRKNIANIIEAYKQVLHDDRIPCLVLAGKKGWLYDEIFRKIKELGIQDKVIFTGYLEKEEAPVLLSRAKLFLFPSLYEGFGMPVIEAMACGTPVITSNTTSLREIAEDAAILVDPSSVEEIKNAIKYALKQDMSNLIEKGFKRAQQYTWENASLKLEEVLERIIDI